MRSILGLAAWAASLTSATLAIAQEVPEQGRVVYSGDYVVTVVNQKRQSRQVKGKVTHELTFNGALITGVTKISLGTTATTGSTGTYRDGYCVIEGPDAITEGRCDANGFQGKITSKPRARDTVSGTFSTRAQSVIADVVSPARTRGDIASQAPSGAASSGCVDRPISKSKERHLEVRLLRYCPDARRMMKPAGQAGPPVHLNQRAWVGRKPSDLVNGIDFFIATGTTLQVMRVQDSVDGFSGFDERPIIWGKVVEGALHGTLTGTFAIPFCREGECANPDQAATRLMAFWGGGSAIYSYPYEKGISVCKYTPAYLGLYNTGDEMVTAKCFFIDRKPGVISAANLLQEASRNDKENEAAQTARLASYPSRPECYPRIVGQDEQHIGTISFPCLGF